MAYQQVGDMTTLKKKVGGSFVCVHLQASIWRECDTSRMQTPLKFRQWIPRLDYFWKIPNNRNLGYCMRTHPPTPAIIALPPPQVPTIGLYPSVTPKLLMRPGTEHLKSRPRDFSTSSGSNHVILNHKWLCKVKRLPSKYLKLLGHVLFSHLDLPSF